MAMTFKTFSWRQDPHTYREVLEREPVYTKNESDETVFSGMGALKRTISGEGVFFGDSAYTDYLALAKLFEDSTAGKLKHPVFGEKSVYFTGLELLQEPKPQCVAYSFTFLGADETGAIPK